MRHQVGCGAYKIDLAVVDPNDPERYVLAIEHDGAAYASAPAARDRDRLRPQVLAQLGWRLHRIWSLDWWDEPEREIQRAHGAIVTAIAAGRQRRARRSRRTAAARPSRDRFARHERGVAAGSATRSSRSRRSGTGGGRCSLAAGSGPTEATPAVRARGHDHRDAGPARARCDRDRPVHGRRDPAGRRTPDDLFAPRHLAELGKVVEQVLAAEAPMHVDLLARRVGAYFGIGRVTQRVTDQVRIALAGRGKWGDEQDVVWRLDQDPACVPAVRVAGQGPSARRDIDEVPLSELAAAARIVVERAARHRRERPRPRLARACSASRGSPSRSRTGSTQGVRLAVARELIRIADGKALLPSD